MVSKIFSILQKEKRTKKEKLAYRTMMTKNEFIQKAAIELAAALIEPYNNSAQGLNEWQEEQLVIRASRMAVFLVNTLEIVAEDEGVQGPIFAEDV